MATFTLPNTPLVTATSNISVLEPTKSNPVSHSSPLLFTYLSDQGVTLCSCSASFLGKQNNNNNNSGSKNVSGKCLGTSGSKDVVVNAGFVRYVLNGNMGRKVVDDDDLEALTAVAVVCAESIQIWDDEGSLKLLDVFIQDLIKSHRPPPQQQSIHSPSFTPAWTVLPDSKLLNSPTSYPMLILSALMHHSPGYNESPVPYLCFVKPPIRNRLEKFTCVGLIPFPLPVDCSSQTNIAISALSPVDKTGNRLLVGLDDGHIVLVEVTESPQTSLDIKRLASVKLKAFGVTALEALPYLDDVENKEHYFVATYSTGHFHVLRVSLSTSSISLITEVAAHVAPITGVYVPSNVSDTHQILTYAEDVATVWNITKQDDLVNVKVTKTNRFHNLLISGAWIYRDAIIVSVYDDKSLYQVEI